MSEPQRCGSRDTGDGRPCQQAVKQSTKTCGHGHRPVPRDWARGSQTPGSASAPLPSLFSAEDLIHAYSRAEAIEDGILVDVGSVAKEAGFLYPVAMTRAAWQDLVAWDDENQGLQDESGRLWDVLWMARDAVRRAKACGQRTDRLAASVFRVPNKKQATRARPAEFVVQVGPGDNAEPVITILLPGED